MRLNAAMLYEAVREETPVTLLGEGEQERTLMFPCFYDGDPTHLMAGGVYLTEGSAMPQSIPAEQNILWVCWSEDVPPLRHSCPVLLFEKERDPQRILNILQRVFARFSLWKEQIWNILGDGSSVNRMIAVSESFFAHPLCVVDASMNYLGYSASFMSQGRKLFFPRGDEAPAPALFYDKDQDRIAPLLNHDFPLGTFYMIHTQEPYSQTELILFQLLSEKLAQALQNLSMLSGLYRNSFKQQMETYFQTRQLDEDEFFESLWEWGGQPEDTFICYKVKASHINQKINAEYICSIFENALRASIAFWHDAVLVVLVDVDRSGCREEAIHAKMAELLGRLHLRAGVSLPFTDLTRSWYYFRQACCAFDEGYPVDREETLYFFRKYVAGYMLHHCLGEFPRSYLLDEGMQKLLEHDRQYSVSYQDTLRAFFACGMNMSQTAELLGIHRTSLNSRIQKIRECLDHELTPEYILYIQMILAIFSSQK